MHFSKRRLAGGGSGKGPQSREAEVPRPAAACSPGGHTGTRLTIFRCGESAFQSGVPRPPLPFLQKRKRRAAVWQRHGLTRHLQIAFPWNPERAPAPEVSCGRGWPARTRAAGLRMRTWKNRCHGGSRICAHSPPWEPGGTSRDMHGFPGPAFHRARQHPEAAPNRPSRKPPQPPGPLLPPPVVPGPACHL